MKKFISMLLFIVLTGCLPKSPGDQCLDSFRMTLKDPDSGKMLSYTEPTLTYSATNSYGARTQGKALCKLGFEKNWVRDSVQEKLMILNKASEKLNASTQCMKSKKTKSTEECDGGSAVIRHAHMLGRDVDLDALQEEVGLELGFR